MTSEIFIDTSGFYALLVKDDGFHAVAAEILKQARSSRGRFVTSDYVLDETATLLKARGHRELLADFFAVIPKTKALKIERMNWEWFEVVQRSYLKHADKAWSFTDCFSFAVMKQLRLNTALTTDIHFTQAGFTRLLFLRS